MVPEPALKVPVGHAEQVAVLEVDPSMQTVMFACSPAPQDLEHGRQDDSPVGSACEEEFQNRHPRRSNSSPFHLLEHTAVGVGVGVLYSNTTFIGDIAVCNAGCNPCAFLAGHPQPPQKGKLMNKIWSDFCWGGYLLERGGGWSCAFRPMLERGVLTDLTQIFQN